MQISNISPLLNLTTLSIFLEFVQLHPQIRFDYFCAINKHKIAKTLFEEEMIFAQNQFHWCLEFGTITNAKSTEKKITEIGSPNESTSLNHSIYTNPTPTNLDKIPTPTKPNSSNQVTPISNGGDTNIPSSITSKTPEQQSYKYDQHLETDTFVRDRSLGMLKSCSWTFSAILNFPWCGPQINLSISYRKGKHNERTIFDLSRKWRTRE